jgi:hypothetical protein
VRGGLGRPSSSNIFTQFKIYLRSFVNRVVAALLGLCDLRGIPVK